MAAQTHGVTGVTFGTPTISGYIVQNFDLETKPALMLEIPDEDGKVCHRRYDDITTEGTVEAYFKGATLPTVGTVLTVDSVKYVVESVGEKVSNKENTKISLKLKTSEGVTLV